MKDIEVLRNGNWGKDGSQDIFYYTLKLINNSQFPLHYIEILLASIPQILEIDSHSRKIGSLNPNSFIEIIFKFKPKSSGFGGDRIEVLCSCTDHLGYSQSIQIDPWTVCYDPKLITPEKVQKDKKNKVLVDPIIKYRGSSQSIEIKRGSLEKDFEEIDQILPRISGDMLYNFEEQAEVPEKSYKESQISHVYFSVYTPTSLSPGIKFILNVWAYLKEQKTDMEKIASKEETYEKKDDKGPIPAKKGDIFQIRLLLPPPFEVLNDIDSIIWLEEITNATFPVSVPDDISSGNHLGHVEIFMKGIQVLRIDFSIKIGEINFQKIDVTQEIKRINKVFASYSRSDQIEVLQAIQGIQAVGIKVFLDNLSMSQGDYFEEKILKNILSSDKFFLFWSRAAMNSVWVEKEWNYALDNRSLDFIQPIPLEDPDTAPPPKKLASKHFFDKTRIYLDYLKLIKQQKPLVDS
ncbi:MAG: toll/interleukin-1 receptor domain-containing protein [Candidatus Hermodarchaeota archaeon]